MQEQGKLQRRSVVARILANRGDILVVTGLGSPTYDCAAAGDHPLNFYLWGAMGSAVTVGLGLALAQPQRRVLVITGDGLKTLDAVRGTFETHTIEPSVAAFEAGVPQTVSV